MTGTAVEVHGVSKRFRVYHDRNQSIKATVLKGGRAKYEEFWALRDVSLEVPEGSTFGLLGLNGSGKSTLLKCIAGILQPNEGRIVTRGRMAAMLEVGSGFHPELSGRENVYLNAAILGMSDREVDRKLESIIDFAGVERFIDHPVKNYSSGMYVRLGFSVAIHTEPELLLVDEVLAVGDKDFQAKCLAKFDELKASGKTVVVVSHSMGTMRTFCDQAAWLDHGELQAVGPASEIVDRYTGDGRASTGTVEGVEGLKRFGTGEVRFTDIELLGTDGQELDTVDPTRPLTVRLSFYAHEPIERPDFAISIRDSQQTAVFNITGHDRDWLPQRLERGHGTVEIQLASLPVRAGGYRIVADVRAEGAEEPADKIWGGKRFGVERGDHTTSGGTLYLPSGFGELRTGAAEGSTRLMPR
ncbi:ABC transporter ATP-binding protein [Agrococcus carbonis]|uniref:ABC-2 type transport system ATP-binding protein n=1 Tax=Agrococcus carbonis TaxID=684552 RepID=A0A1H1M6P4_9MICO|nr:ABC transporter ATP-binding protein [Agrococcus carbonis]SDR81709.1 ABC-2 type transport system ATP-binding protein [Agrococcus carbonis]